MDIRSLTDNYAVSPQIDTSDLAAIKAAGFTTVINNRPDPEIPPALQTESMRKAVESAGLTYVINPVVSGALTQDNIDIQATAIAQSTGPVLAYCASGNRSSVIWALANAGKLSVDDLIGIPARHGYALEWLRPMLENAAD